MATLIAKSSVEAFTKIDNLIFSVYDIDENDFYEIRLTNEKFQWLIKVHKDDWRMMVEAAKEIEIEQGA